MALKTKHDTRKCKDMLLSCTNVYAFIGHSDTVIVM